MSFTEAPRLPAGAPSFLIPHLPAPPGSRDLKPLRSRSAPCTPPKLPARDSPTSCPRPQGPAPPAGRRSSSLPSPPHCPSRPLHLLFPGNLGLPSSSEPQHPPWQAVPRCSHIPALGPTTTPLTVPTLLPPHCPSRSSPAPVEQRLLGHTRGPSTAPQPVGDGLKTDC